MRLWTARVQETVVTTVHYTVEAKDEGEALELLMSGETVREDHATATDREVMGRTLMGRVVENIGHFNHFNHKGACSPG